MVASSAVCVVCIRFCLDEVNPSVRTYIHIFTSLCTVQFNWVRWLQVSQYLFLDLAGFIKLGVDFLFAKYWEGIAENKRCDAEEEKQAEY